MTISILDLSPNRNPATTFFDLNNQPYKFLRTSEDIRSVDQIDFMLGDRNPLPDMFPTKRNIVLDLWHVPNNGFAARHQRLLEDPNTCIIYTGIDQNFQHPRVLTIDFLFNTTKAYFTHWAWRPDTTPVNWNGEHCYQNFRLPLADIKRRIFVAPCRTYRFQGMRWYRNKLFELLVQYQDLGYIGNYEDRPEFVLYAHGELPWEGLTIEELEQRTQPPVYRGQWMPPHNLYLKHSFISIYTESVETGSTIFVSEKSYDPLLRGHFILPFSCSGYVEHLKKLGVRLPGFIDYSYDAIQNDDQRFEAYSHEVQRLLSLDFATWQQHWTDNIELLQANKLYMIERPYDRIDLTKLL